MKRLIYSTPWGRLDIFLRVRRPYDEGALTPPWVAMAEAALPQNWTDARNIIMANSPWMLLLVAFERAFEGQYFQAGGAFLLCLVALGIAVHVKAFEGLSKRSGRRRLAFILITIGASFLGAGIYLLASQQNPTDGRIANDASETERQLAATQRELQETQHQLALAQQQPGPSPVPVAKGVFTKKSIRELRALYEGRTALQADVFMTDEKGKLIDVEGTIVRVDSGMAFLQNGGDSIECRFGLEWNSKLSTFRNGELMKARGTISPSQNGAQIYLQQCELRD
jgi:hypothetical protein